MAYLPPVQVTGGSLTPEQVTTWREQGCILVDGLLPDNVIQDAVKILEETFPEGNPNKEHNDFGSGGKMEFPCNFPPLNQITLHENIMNAVKQLLGTDDIRLTQSDAWPKYGRDSSDGPYDNR